jgi:hypothetical protein
VGHPGVGKYTVASALERLLAEHDESARVIDNHYTCNPVLGLLRQDGITPLPSVVWDRVSEIREAVARTIESLSPVEWSFIFTHVIDNLADEGWVERLRLVAESRASRFIVVRLSCDLDELLRRVVTPSRRERMKSVSTEDARKAFELGVPDLNELGPLTIDVTTLTPADTAEAILRHRGDT